MIWNEFVVITMPAPKHILEVMNLKDANGKMKVSVVQRSVAEEAVKAIQDHVKTHGWEEKTVDGITVKKIEEQKCYKVIYKGNHWMTHASSGQLWPLHGRDIFSPPASAEVKDVKDFIKRWKGSQGKTRPAQYMNYDVEKGKYLE